MNNLSLLWKKPFIPATGGSGNDNVSGLGITEQNWGWREEERECVYFHGYRHNSSWRRNASEGRIADLVVKKIRVVVQAG